MAGDNVWVLGAHMTKFGRHDDKDVLDLAAIASLAALADGGVTIQDMDVIGAGSLFNAASGIGQQIQKQIGQTGIPVFNVVNACATGATAVRAVYLSIKAGEADMGLAVGVEQMGKMGLLGMGAGGSGKTEYVPSGRDGRVMPTEGLLGTFSMPGVFAQAGMQYLYENDDVDVEHFYKISEKNHAHSTLNP
ncbi:MAG: thiolase family protein, partial [Actinobacteria bacterium]|nr:thiolase family protein [Actinomycetota bacterium]